MPEPTETLRDKFAMAALTGMLANSMRYCPCEETAEEAYQFADAMIEQRNKSKQ